MENNLEEIEINKFFLLTKHISSDFFNQLFQNNIKKIVIHKTSLDPLYITIKIIFTKNTANYLNIVHGGSIAILFENITHMLLFYINKYTFNTKDINLIYKRQVILNEEYDLKIQIEKIKYKTVFAHCNLSKGNEETTEGNLIMEKDVINKI